MALLLQGYPFLQGFPVYSLKACQLAADVVALVMFQRPDAGEDATAAQTLRFLLVLLVILLHVLLPLPLPGWRLLDGSLVRACCGFPLLWGIL